MIKINPFFFSYPSSNFGTHFCKILFKIVKNSMFNLLSNTKRSTFGTLTTNNVQLQIKIPVETLLEIKVRNIPFYFFNQYNSL